MSQLLEIETHILPINLQIGFKIVQRIACSLESRGHQLRYNALTTSVAHLISNAWLWINIVNIWLLPVISYHIIPLLESTCIRCELIMSRPSLKYIQIFQSISHCLQYHIYECLAEWIQSKPELLNLWHVSLDVFFEHICRAACIIGIRP